MVIEEISDFSDGDSPTLPELRAETVRWMAAFGWEPSRRDGRHRPWLEYLCQQLWALALGMSLDELLPVWASDAQEEQVHLQDVVRTVGRRLGLRARMASMGPSRGCLCTSR